MRRFSASLLLLGLVACQDAPLDPGLRSDAISDAAHGGGNPHFYFRPPMVRPTSYGGTFDPTLAPTVEICEWRGKACVGAPIATFSMEMGRGSEVVRVEPGAEQYVVNWHTGKYPVSSSKQYRIHILVGDYLLGFADVDFSKRGRARNRNTGEYVYLKDGTTLPIKFRIEEGAVPSGAEPAQPVAVAGYLHGCAVAQGGAAYCWGQNTSGELGDGTLTESAVPVAVAGGHVFEQVVTGMSHSCALDADGAAYCWGANDAGALGRGGVSTLEATPAPVAGGHSFVRLTAGWFHTCGLEADGSLWCWGSNDQGQLGVGSTSAYAAAPVQALGGPYRQVDAGYMSTCGVTDAGEGLCWGNNELRQLGYTSGEVSPTPTPVAGGHAFSEIHVSRTAGCGLGPDGQALCWGTNVSGVLGQGSLTPSISAPAAVAGGLSFARLDLGGMHACGVLADGTAYCWGYNETGALGIGSSLPATGTPTPVAGGDQWAELGAGWATTCGVTTAGTGKCWGWNAYGQAGTGNGAHIVAAPTELGGGLAFGG